MASDTSLVFNIIAKDNASSKFSKLKGIAIASLAAIGVAAVKFGIDSVRAFSDAEKSQAKLQDAFDRFPRLANGNIDALRDLNTALAQKTRFDDDASASAEATLATFKLNQAQIEQAIPLIQDYAAKTGKDLPAAAAAFGKGIMGSGRMMKELGIRFKDSGDSGKNFATIIDGMRAKVGGFAEKEGKSAAGQAEILKNQFGELEEKVGGLLVPALLKLVGPLKDVLEFIDRNGKTIAIVGGIFGTLAAVIWTIVTAVKVWTAVQIALDVVLTANPIGLIIVAIGALVAAIVWVATKTRFFQTVWGAVWGFMKTVGAWFAGPFAGFFVRTWNSITSGVSRVYHNVVDYFNRVIKFLTGIPGKISSIASRMWSGLTSSFRAAINFLIGGWNALDFGIHVHLPAFLGGAGFDVNDVIPDIPYLAKGGVVKARPGGTVMVAGEGREDEVVAPLSKLGNLGGGPAKIVIELRGGDREMRRWFRRMIQSDGSTQVTFATEN